MQEKRDESRHNHPRHGLSDKRASDGTCAPCCQKENRSTLAESQKRPVLRQLEGRKLSFTPGHEELQGAFGKIEGGDKDGGKGQKNEKKRKASTNSRVARKT